jgi:hypothetical protein
MAMTEQLTRRLTTPQLLALAAVRDGLVTQRFNHNGNIFQGPNGIGAIVYRKLRDARLIEDGPGQKTPGGLVSSHKQQLTEAGRAALATVNHNGE